MLPTKWIPPLGGLIVLLILSLFAGIGDWSATAVYGVLFAGLVTWAVLLGITERDEPPSQR
jgi:hypothetical protein